MNPLCFTKKFLSIILIILLTLSCNVSAAKRRRRRRGARIGKKVTFYSTDGIVLKGLFRPPSNPKRRTFVLLHGLGSNQEEWQPFIRKLRKFGFGFLSFDARGHGNSTLTKDNKIISYENFGTSGPDSHWSKMVSDLEEAIKYLTKKKGIYKKRIGLIGASMGANVCLIYAASNEFIRPVVLLSPGLNYVGLETRDAIMAFKAKKNKKSRPIALVASPNDTYSYQSSCLLHKQTKANKREVFYHGVDSNHGVNMLNKNLTNKIIRWISKY